MIKIICILSILTVAFCFYGVSFAAEHPGEHPATPAKSEHPGEAAEHPGETAERPGEADEHPGETAEHPGKKATLSAAQIIRGIKGHINSVTEANEGYLPLYDSKEGKGLRLTLIRVHEDRVSYIEKENAYFACTDFRTDDGMATYDVDFWMKEGEAGGLEVYRTKIHKKDGIPRFTYQADEIVLVED